MAGKRAGDHTPAAKRLRQLRVPHEVVAFDPAIRSGVELSRAIGDDPAGVFKTLVVEEDPPRGKPWLVLVPSDAELDLKQFATAAGVRKVRMAAQRDAERATGMRAGAISAIPIANRGFRVVIDSSARDRESVLVSAGTHGFDVRIAVDALATVLDAQFLPVTRPMT